jgi:GNAT superfamily N-acetyltransferase
LARLLVQLGYETAPASIPARLHALEAEGSVAFVAVADDDRIVGAASGAMFATLHADRPTAYITALVADQATRRAGVGRQLIAALEDWARDGGCHRLSVTSAEHRADAHVFYPSCGFPYTGRRFSKPLGDASS